MRLLASSFVCSVFLFILWYIASKVWDVHVDFEETEMENGMIAIKQAVNTAVDRCLTTVRTAENGKLGCTYDYGDLDYISLTFNVTTQKISADLSRSLPFSSSLQCHNPKGGCHTLVLFLVGWWFGSRHSILFMIVLFMVILFVCLFMYPVVMTFVSSVKDLLSSNRSRNQHSHHSMSSQAYNDGSYPSSSSFDASLSKLSTISSSHTPPPPQSYVHGQKPSVLNTLRQRYIEPDRVEL